MTQSRDPATIAAAIRSARDYVATEPSAARSADTAAHARLLDGLRVAVAGPNGWHVETDMAKSVGGGAAGLRPILNRWARRRSRLSLTTALRCMPLRKRVVRPLDLYGQHGSTLPDQRHRVTD